MLIGLAGISTDAQLLHDALTKLGCGRILLEKVSTPRQPSAWRSRRARQPAPQRHPGRREA